MGPVIFLTLCFIVVAYVVKVLREFIDFFKHGNSKYIFLDFLADYIYYGNDIGVEASLKMDSPSTEVFQRRVVGQEYLRKKLSTDDSSMDAEKMRSEGLVSKFVDCRFSLKKVLIPLYRELEVPSVGRNFVTELRPSSSNYRSNNRELDVASDGIHEVKPLVLPRASESEYLTYLGNDAVNTLSIKHFFDPVEKKIQNRLSKSNSSLKYAPVSLNPDIEENVNKILNMTGMDQVRYSLSGSEAMDAAIKDIRSSTRGKGYIVRFKSAYHGHVSGVDFLNCKKQIFLNECDLASLDFIEKYHYRISAVLVNPMQHFTGINKVSPPGEKLTMGSRDRSAVSKDEYAEWLHALREKCAYCTKYLTKIAFVVDDIYFAFRTPEIFSTNYFTHPETKMPLRPDVLVLGKGVAAGYPLSMVLGKRGFLNFYDKKYLLQVNKTTGTLSAWYNGIVASNVFLDAINGSSKILKINVQTQLSAMMKKFDIFSAKLNSMFQEDDIPVRIRNFSNTFSINYLNQSMYNSRYPQYLMAEGLYLGNYSTGKFNINADAKVADLDDVANKFLKAAVKMRDHGFFESKFSGTTKLNFLVKLGARFMWNNIKLYYNQIMDDKRIDIEVSHNHPVNKFGHFWSSVGMIVLAYPYLFMGESLKCCFVFFVTHVVRQSGHFFYEHQDRNIEKLKFGHKDGSKKEAVAFLMFAAFAYYLKSEIWMFLEKWNLDVELKIDQYVGLVALLTIVPHYVEISYQYGVLRGISWMLKIFTDPFTDLLDFYEFWAIHPKWFLRFKDQKATYELDIETKQVRKSGNEWIKLE